MSSKLQGFNNLPDDDLNEMYCVHDAEFEFKFCTSLEEMYKKFDRGEDLNGGRHWDELSEEKLEIWADRLFEQNVNFELLME